MANRQGDRNSPAEPDTRNNRNSERDPSTNEEQVRGIGDETYAATEDVDEFEDTEALDEQEEEPPPRRSVKARVLSFLCLFP